MADLIQFRRDTTERWQQYNPILTEGELGFVLDTQNYKIGDGVHTWNDLPLRGFNGNVVDALGNDAGVVISQKGITDILAGVINRNDRVIDYSNLSVLDDYISLNPAEGGIYPIVRGKGTSNPTTVYIMIVHWDNMMHQCNQWLFGNLLIEDGQITSGTHVDGAAYICHRSYSTRHGNKSWSKWKYFQENFLWDGSENLNPYNLGLNKISYTAQKINEFLQEIKDLISQTKENIENNCNDKIDDLSIKIESLENLIKSKTEVVDSWESEINNLIHGQESLQEQINELKQSL